jgi:hypothetical protein
MRRFGELVGDVMLGRGVDPVLARGLLRMINTLQLPDGLMGDPEFMAHMAAYFAAPAERSTPPAHQRISRDALLLAVAA